LLVLVTFPSEALVQHIEAAFRSYHNNRCVQAGAIHSSDDFKKALKELDGTFINTRRIHEEVIIRFQNPSIRDFLRNLLLEGEFLEGITEDAVFFEQMQWFSATLSDSSTRGSTKKLFELRQYIADKL
jgi:hypothetical protein